MWSTLEDTAAAGGNALGRRFYSSFSSWSTRLESHCPPTTDNLATYFGENAWLHLRGELSGTVWEEEHAGNVHIYMYRAAELRLKRLRIRIRSSWVSLNYLGRYIYIYIYTIYLQALFKCILLIFLRSVYMHHLYLFYTLEYFLTTLFCLNRLIHFFKFI